MADNGRWFKVWTSILDDPHFQELPLEDIARWTLLGALTKVSGNRGVLAFNGTGRRLRELLRVDTLDALKDALKRLPNITLEEGKNRHGELTVTFKNWKKYQEDSTQAQRQKTSRSKKRGDEKRGEEIRTPPTPPDGLSTNRTRIETGPEHVSETLRRLGIPAQEGAKT